MLTRAGAVALGAAFAIGRRILGFARRSRARLAGLTVCATCGARIGTTAGCAECDDHRQEMASW